MKRIIAIMLAAVLMLGLFVGCDAVGEIAGNVADAAKAELEKQIEATLEKHKVNVIELGTAVGKLNDEGSELQFYCAALVQSDSDAVPKAAADALGNLFEKSGIQIQQGNKVESKHLVHKDITFKFEDFEEGKTYYIIYVYSSDLSIQLPEFTFPNGSKE